MKVYLGFMKRDAHDLKAGECCLVAAELPAPGTGDRDDFIWPDFGIEAPSVEEAFDLYGFGTDMVNKIGRWRISNDGQTIVRVAENIPALNNLKALYESQQTSRQIAGRERDPRIDRMIANIGQETSMTARLINYIRK